MKTTGDAFTAAIAETYAAMIAEQASDPTFPTERDRMLVAIVDHLGEMPDVHLRAELRRLVAIARGRRRFGVTDGETAQDIADQIAHLEAELAARREVR
jgi:hypothetical protein